MGRCRVVNPDTVRVFLADEAKRAYEELVARKDPKATKDELEKAARRVLLAVEDGDFIVLKKQLSAGEQRRILSDMVQHMEYGEKVALDPQKVGDAKIRQYLVGWSLLDAEGQPLPIDALDSIEPEAFMEIDAAVDRHEAAMEQEREERKNALAGSIKSRAI